MLAQLFVNFNYDFSMFYRYEKNGSQCTNKNECEMKPCDTDLGFCTDTDGSFYCSCQTGYTLPSDGLSCQDINECLSASPPCGANAKCSNTLGSYTCKCKNGYTGNASIFKYITHYIRQNNSLFLLLHIITLCLVLA